MHQTASRIIGPLVARRSRSTVTIALSIEKCSRSTSENRKGKTKEIEQSDEVHNGVTPDCEDELCSQSKIGS